MKHGFRLFVTALIHTAILSLISFTLGPSPSLAKPSVAWTPPQLEITAFPGTIQTTSVEFTASNDIQDASLFVAPEISEMLQMELDGGTVEAGKKYNVPVIVEVAASTSSGTYEGTVHVRSGKRTIPATLKVTLNVVAPTAQHIPDEFALPTADRIVRDPVDNTYHAKNEIIVVPKLDASEESIKAIVAIVNGVFIGRLPKSGYYQISVPVDEWGAVKEIIRQLEADPSVKVASRHWFSIPQIEPNDFTCPQDENGRFATWCNTNTGNWALKRIKARDAWDEETGKQDIVKIAVIDSGFSKQKNFEDKHEDFEDNMEKPVYPPVYYNFDHPADLLDLERLRYHGTVVSSVIGAQGDNGVGITGVMWDVKILPYPIGYISGPETACDKGVRFSDPLALEAIEQAISDDKAQVINYSGAACHNSEGQATSASSLFKEKIEKFKDKALFVIAAGNTNKNIKVCSPANLSQLGNVITVAATNRQNQLAQFNSCSPGSNWGDGILAAPGDDVYAAIPNNSYDMLPGTSVAAPIVSGIAGLIWSAKKDDLKPYQVKDWIFEGARKGGVKVQGQNFYVVDAYQSLLLATGEPEPTGEIAFVSNRDSNVDIYVMGANGDNPTPLTDDPDADIDPIWSPDGNRIAFRSTRDGNPEIYVMNADGSGQVRITNNSASDYYYFQVWSPDGKQIAYHSNRQDGTPQGVYVANTNGSGEPKNIAKGNKENLPAWSPNSNTIAYQSLQNNSFEIYLVDADGTNRKNLTNDPNRSDQGPVWSPDGKKIAYRSYGPSSAGVNNWEIYVVDADGEANPEPLTDDPDLQDVDPVWSPDGKRIAFRKVTKGSVTVGIYVMNADGSNPIPLVNDPDLATDPVIWSPDSKKIAFASDRTGNLEIYVMDASGGGDPDDIPPNITNDPASDFAPAWHPK